MEKKFFAVVSLVFVVALLISVAVPCQVAAKATTIKFAYTMPKGLSIAEGFEWFASEFPKQSQGKYAVQTYPGSSLVGIMAALDAVKEGVCEIALTGTAVFPKDFPASLATMLPGISFPLTSVEEWQTAYEAWWEFYNTIPEIQNEYKDIHLLWPYPLDPYALVTTKKEVRKAEDFKGMKIGGVGQLMEIVTHNGGATVHQAPPQSYMNMDKGVIDGAFLTYSMVMHYKLPEICDYFYENDFASGTIVILMNKDFYNKMPEEDKKLLAKVYAESAAYSAKGMVGDYIKGKKVAQDGGMNIIVPTQAEKDAWAKSYGPTYKKWVADCKALGVKNPEGILEAWLKISKKYGVDRMQMMDLIK